MRSTPTSLTTARVPWTPESARHPRGRDARVLLVSVFGPFAVDDQFGSRRLNPMELYQNQVTRVQGPFSLRMFHRSWGLMFIQANLESPCTLLDFPTRERFIEEIRSHRYDIVGISAILPNLWKVREMCRLIREDAPAATIVVGGHLANVPDLERRIDADFIVRGDGVKWFRGFLGQDPDQAIRHPLIVSGFGTRCMGVGVGDGPGDTAATVIPSVGCPMGCNFCSTSAMFGGKGKFINFYETGDDLFDIMSQLEAKMRVRSFFVMDENFLLHRRRALRLLELMKKFDKPWSLYVFSSAHALRLYSIEQLVALGISWVWMGLEGKDNRYPKLGKIDTLRLVRSLQSHGICILGSTIIGLEHHTEANIDEAIDWAVEHETDFHQFMLYTPLPGTALYTAHLADGSLLGEQDCPAPLINGQERFNFRHHHIPVGAETEFIVRAFRRDFETNGPSVLRMVRTRLKGWRRYKDHPDPRVRDRIRWENRSIPTTFAAAVWAARRWFRNNPGVRRKLDRILRDIYREFGLRSRFYAYAAGQILSWFMRREDRRLLRGWSYEPPTFYEHNHVDGQIIPLGVQVGDSKSPVFIVR
jgi:hypothetical protein